MYAPITQLNEWQKYDNKQLLTYLHLGVTLVRWVLMASSDQSSRYVGPLNSLQRIYFITILAGSDIETWSGEISDDM